MKCSQKLCNRSKNLNSFGNCEVCEEVIKETNKKHEKVKEKRVIDRVEVDMKHMISMHRNLLNGDKVDTMEPQQEEKNEVPKLRVKSFNDCGLTFTKNC